MIQRRWCSWFWLSPPPPPSPPPYGGQASELEATCVPSWSGLHQQPEGGMDKPTLPLWNKVEAGQSKHQLAGDRRAGGSGGVDIVGTIIIMRG